MDHGSATSGAHTQLLAPRLRTTAAAAATLTAVWLEAPLFAAAGGMYLIASSGLWLSGRRRGGGDGAAQARAGAPSTPDSAIASESTVQHRQVGCTAVDAEVIQKVIQLLRDRRVQLALEVARAHSLLDATAPAPGEPVELQWLRELAPVVVCAEERLSLPPRGESWHGPFEHEDGDNWSIQVWYKWTGQDLLTMVSKTTLRGTLQQAVALLYEADLAHNWLPCVVGGVANWSDAAPGLMVDLHAKLPVMPKIFSTMMHRAFLDTGLQTTGSASPGIIVVDWTPAAEKITDGRFCGMEVPPPPPRSIRGGGVTLAHTLIQQEGADHVSFTAAIDNKFPQRLCPDFVLRRFFKMNSQVCAQRMFQCLRDFEGRGYGARVAADRYRAYSGLCSAAT